MRYFFVNEDYDVPSVFLSSVFAYDVGLGYDVLFVKMSL